jgi:hypothetical protein
VELATLPCLVGLLASLCTQLKRSYNLRAWGGREYMNGPGMNSHAHPALGSVGAWFYRWAVGLRLDDGSLAAPSDGYGKGWRRVLFAPGCVTDPRLPSARARVTSLHGPIEVSWANASSKLLMNVMIPPDVIARVVVPSHVGGGAHKLRITESGNVIWQNNQPTSGQAYVVNTVVEPGPDNSPSVVIRVGSGRWHFIAGYA